MHLLHIIMTIWSPVVQFLDFIGSYRVHSYTAFFFYTGLCGFSLIQVGWIYMFPQLKAIGRCFFSREKDRWKFMFFTEP